MKNQAPQDALPPLSRVSISVHIDDQIPRFRAHTATFTILPEGRRVRLGFAGAKGSVDIELPRIASWQLLEQLLELSTACDEPSPKLQRRRR